MVSVRLASGAKVANNSKSSESQRTKVFFAHTLCLSEVSRRLSSLHYCGPWWDGASFLLSPKLHRPLPLQAFPPLGLFLPAPHHLKRMNFLRFWVLKRVIELTTTEEAELMSNRYAYF